MNVLERVMAYASKHKRTPEEMVELLCNYIAEVDAWDPGGDEPFSGVTEYLAEDRCCRCGTIYSQESIDGGRCLGSDPNGQFCGTMITAVMPEKGAELPRSIVGADYGTIRLWKTTIEIWSEYDGEGVEIEDLARSATNDDAICTKQESVEVTDYHQLDHDIDEFFGLVAPEDATWDDGDQAGLDALRSTFEALGGRGIELADQIDALERRRDFVKGGVE